MTYIEKPKPFVPKTIEAIFLSDDTIEAAQEFVASKKNGAFIGYEDIFNNTLVIAGPGVLYCRVILDSWITFNGANFGCCNQETFQQTYEPCTP